MSVRQVDVEIRSGDDVYRAWLFFTVAFATAGCALLPMFDGLGSTLAAMIEPARSRVVHATLDFLNQGKRSRQVQ
ncbi:MAG: hypothetical protein WBN14_14685 [Polyangiales bacterium]